MKAQRREEYLQCIPIEGKFAQGKNGYRLNYILAKGADTSLAWINSIFLVMNLLILLKFFFALNTRVWVACAVLFNRLAAVKKHLCWTVHHPAPQMTKLV